MDSTTLATEQKDAGNQPDDNGNAAQTLDKEANVQATGEVQSTEDAGGSGEVVVPKEPTTPPAPPAAKEAPAPVPAPVQTPAQVPATPAAPVSAEKSVSPFGQPKTAQQRRPVMPSMPVVRQDPVKTAATTNPLSVQPIADTVKLAEDPNLTSFYERLVYLDKALGYTSSPTVEEAAVHLQNYYQVIVNLVERPATDLEFATHWTLLLRMNSESPAGGFLSDRLFRGKAYWKLGHEKMTHFESLWNLMDATVRHRADYKAFVNDRLVMKGFTGGAQGRLGSFYRNFG